MIEPKQLRIMIALTDHIAGMSKAGGYRYDLAGSVFRGKGAFSEQPVPFISILESTRTDPRPAEGGDEKLRRVERWELLVQGWAKAERDTPTDELYRLKAEVERRIAEVISQKPDHSYDPILYRLQRMIVGLQIGPGIVRAATPQPGGVEAFYLPVTIRYAINVADPYE